MTQNSTNQSEIVRVRMEINGNPYYVKSKGNVPYLYDVDTNDEVGYWSSKKGQYVMFSLYNRMMKQKYNDNLNEDDLKSNSSDLQENWSETDSESSGKSSKSSFDDDKDDDDDLDDHDHDDEDIEEIKSNSDEEETQVKNQQTTKKTDSHSIILLFVILFVYLIFQKEFQSIYFDFIFLILINLLNTLKVFELLDDTERHNK